MNSPVLKPCRWVAAFLLAIAGVAPSSGLRRTIVSGFCRGEVLTAAEGPRRTGVRGAGDARLVLRVEAFFVRRATDVVFFDRWRIFPATVFCVGLTSLVAGCSR